MLTMIRKRSVGSLIDAGMGAYYELGWASKRSSGAHQSLFLCWFESSRETLAISLPTAGDAVGERHSVSDYFSGLVESNN